MSDLYCKDLCMTFADPMSGSKVEALKDIQFNLKEGEILTVLGPSGCGKTTLLNMIAGFITPTSGTLSLGGVDIQAPGAERGMVFQQGALFEWLTVARNVDFGLRIKCILDVHHAKYRVVSAHKTERQHCIHRVSELRIGERRPTR